MFNGIMTCKYIVDKKLVNLNFTARMSRRKEGRNVFRVPTVMEKHGKALKKILLWKVIEKSWKMGRKNKVVEIKKYPENVNEFLYC